MWEWWSELSCDFFISSRSCATLRRYNCLWAGVYDWPRTDREKTYTCSSAFP